MTKLEKKRKELGLTLEQMAKCLKCSPRQYFRYEKGQAKIPLDIAIKWAKKIKVDMNAFIKLYK